MQLQMQRIVVIILGESPSMMPSRSYTTSITIERRVFEVQKLPRKINQRKKTNTAHNFHVTHSQAQVAY